MDANLLISNGIDVNKGLELLGDKSTYDEMLGAFITESDTRIPNIKKFKDAMDLPNYVILTHAMKSDSKYLGFSKLAELSLQHEMAGRNSDTTYITEHFDELISEADRILTIVKQYLGKGL